MNIEDLVNKYFEGETSCEEEREIRQYFTSEDVPEDLQIYRPIFAYFDKEVKQNKKVRIATNKRRSIRLRLTYTLSGIAAGLFIAISVSGIYKHLNAQPDNYVLIDGKKYTDANLVQQEAQAAFQDVSISKDEVFATLFNE